MKVNIIGNKDAGLFSTIKNNKLFRCFNRNNKDTFEKFKPLMFEKAASVNDAKNYARKNFQIHYIDSNNMADINNVNRSLCRIYNINKGKISFPPFIKVYKHHGERYSGGYGSGLICLNSCCGDMFSVLSHEIAHYNHEKVSRNYPNLGKKLEIIDMGSNNFYFFNKFMSDKPALKSIKKEICGYACSSPAEFIACTFETVMRGKKLSPEIFRLYREYEGPNAEILSQYGIKK